MIALRPHQVRSVASILDAWQTVRRVLLVAPTGSGKTVILAEVCRLEVAAGHRVLIVVHREEILRQTLKQLAAHGVWAERLGPRATAPVVVAMVQTLARRGPGCLPFAPDLTIADEAHHARSVSWRHVLGWFDRRTLLLTATPWGIPPALVDHTIVGALPSELLRTGHLPPMRLVTYAAPNTADVRVRGGEYAPDQLAAVTNVSELRGDVLRAYLAAGALPAFGFAVDRAHSRAMVQDFVAAGVTAEHVDGDSPDRAAILQRFSTGQTRVLWNCDLLGEGVDVPGARLAIIARANWSLRAWLQQVGRIRAHGDVARVHDHGGNLERHGHPQLDRDYSLTADVRPRSARKATLSATTQKRVRLVVERDAPEVQIDPELQALGFVPDPMPTDASEEPTEKLTGLAA